jgi:hypothetical protein
VPGRWRLILAGDKPAPRWPAGAPFGGVHGGCNVTTYHVQLFASLVPRTLWRGGRITHTDVLTLDDAALQASKHAGAEIAVADFLRAAARGEIALHAVCPRAVVMPPCREADKPLDLPENSLATLPLTACKALANRGEALWRTYDGFEAVQTIVGNELCRFTRWQLADGEPDILTTLADCRVTGRDVHTLADAFIGAAVPATDTAPPATRPTWALVEPKRFPGIRWPIFLFLQRAHAAGQTLPKARHVLDAWQLKKPLDIADVMQDGVKFQDAKGVTHEASLRAIQKAIDRLTKPDRATKRPLSAR